MKTIRSISSLIFATLLLVANCPAVNAQVMKTRTMGKEDIISFSATPDGKLIALGSKSSIEVINTETDVTTANLPCSNGVKTLCLSKDGRLLVISFDNSDKSRNLLVWDLVNNSRSQIIHTHADKIQCIAISPDGKMIATGSKDNTIKLFETRYFNELRSLPAGHTDDVTSLKFSPDNNFLLSGSKDKTMIIWDLANNSILSTLSGHTKKINSVNFSPDGKLVASGSDDKLILVWDILNPQKPLYTLAGHEEAVTSIEFTPDGRFLGSGSNDHTIQLWDFRKSSKLQLKNGIGTDQSEDINFISFYENGNLYTCSGNRNLKYWKWGFPILAIRNIHLDDANQNGKIEGTEKTRIKFVIENSGDANAINLQFNVAELRKVEELIFPPSVFIESIPARTCYDVEIPVSASPKLKNSTGKFSFSDFRLFTNTPFSIKDTSISIEMVAAPMLKVDNIGFAYPDSANELIGKQTGIFQLYLNNSGVGMAYDVKVKVTCDNYPSTMIFDEITDFGNIAYLSTQVLKIPVKASPKTEDGLVNFRFEITESSGISNQVTNYSIKTRKYIPTLVEDIREIVENKVNEWQTKSKWETTEEYKNRVTTGARENQIALFTSQTLDSLVNKDLNWALATTDYDADNESFKISIPKFEPIILKVPREEAKIFERNFKQYKIENLSYTVNTSNYAFLHIELVDSLSMNKTYKYDSQDLIAFSPTLFNFNFDPINLYLPSTSGTTTNTGEVRRISIGRSDVDTNIPEVIVSNPNMYAVIIGNEDYSSRQIGLKTESNVDFAENDAIAFKNYMLKTYGVPEGNIQLYKNATAAEINRGIAWLTNIARNRPGETELVFYFSGHGLPDESTGEGYIIPVDVTGTNLALAIKLGNLYGELSKYPTKKVTVFLDACFSGGGRNQELIALKKVKIKPKDESVAGNMVVFTSSSGDESSGFYMEKQHGLFTYYLLKKIRETKGEVDYQSLINYLKQEVSLRSIVVNAKDQNPQILVSNELTGELNKMRLGSANPGLE